MSPNFSSSPMARIKDRVHPSLVPSRDLATISIHNHRPVLYSITYTMHRHQLHQHDSNPSRHMSLNAVRLPLLMTVFHVSHSIITLQGYVAYSKTILRSSSWTVGLISSLPTISAYSGNYKTSHRLQSLSHSTASLL